MSKPVTLPSVSATTEKSPPPRERAMESREPVSLVIAHSPDRDAAGKVVPLDENVVAFGRDVDAPGVRLNDAHLSRVHFRIAYDGRARAHVLGDARSSNGTFVDGVRVEASPLRDGSVIRAGESVLVYCEGAPMRRLLERIERVSRSELSVLLAGETGTGKEKIAQTVHARSGRSGAFVALNCAALPRELVASELFGHARGAFSGASSARRGLFQSANGGTVFLDEIGDLSFELQGVLLRTLQEGTVRPVGTDEDVAVDARIVSATHHRLDALVAEGRFRADLYARLAQVVVRLPSLRERRRDVMSLAREMAATSGTELRATGDAAEILVRHDWPLNIRELQSLVRAFLATEGEATLDLEYLIEHHALLLRGFRKDVVTNATTDPMTTDLSRNRPALEALLLKHRGNVSAAAADIGKPRVQLYRWFRAIGLRPGRFRQLES